MNPKGDTDMTERERVESMLVVNRLSDLREVSKEIRLVEKALDALRDTKWKLVEELKDLEHDFTATSEGMDVVLSAPPSMRF